MPRYRGLGWGLVLLLAACTPVSPSPSPASITPTSPSAIPSASSSSTPTAGPSSTPLGCVATDQDQYVYHPTRLVVLAACMRVSGTVAVIRVEADGDRHMLVVLDPQFQYLLKPANNGIELGDLVVEPVCVGTTTQADAIDTCKADLDPLTTLPVVGQRVWLEGRYVTDSAHGGWAELHPLYRWGAALGVSEGE